jgi:hypothetical protein
MVLGVQWLESLGPIQWDFTSRTIAFIHDGHCIVWSVASASPAPPTLLATWADVMDDLLQHFAPLFETLIGPSTAAQARAPDTAPAEHGTGGGLTVSIRPQPEA